MKNRKMKRTAEMNCVRKKQNRKREEDCESDVYGKRREMERMVKVDCIRKGKWKGR